MYRLLVFLALTMVVAGNHYCNINASHTMCLFEGIGAQCAVPLSRGLSAEDIKAVLHEHNQHRKRIAWGIEARGNPGPQPPASNMHKLEWDNELATIAQTWAQHCVYDHDICRDVDRFKVAQNIYRFIGEKIRNPSVEHWDRVVKAWYDEVQYFNRSNVLSYRSEKKWSHYAVGSWAVTRFVGCGFMAYVMKDGRFAKYYVCNYGPGGNQPWGTMYKIGAPCRACPRASHCEHGLCVVDKLW